MAWARGLDKSREHGLEQFIWRGPEFDYNVYSNKILEWSEETPKVMHAHILESA
ncbi:hypothetical protein Scep_022504 [Stephania cephalantha]|uniref:Uncharacterized protein n=1 Tax=Stephania cephalantha TaxID=152367 RepID=A0AAP0I2B0_9MAGN